MVKRGSWRLWLGGEVARKKRAWWGHWKVETVVVRYGAVVAW